MKRRCRIEAFTACFLLLHLVLAGFDRGDRYWNGRPQSIGIDFAPNFVTAVLADGPKNFTPLALVQPGPGPNPYEGFMYDAYRGNVLFSDGTINEIIDKESKFEQWYQQITTSAISWLIDLKNRSCWSAVPQLGNFDLFQKFCFPEPDFYEYSPVKPISRFRSLLSQRRSYRLRTMMPKWFRDSPKRSSPRREFISATLDLLLRIKSIALNDYNITITSAAISRPGWMGNGLEDLFDEACLLADIETFEQPRGRAEMGSRIVEFVPEKDNLTVVEHGAYCLEIHRMSYDMEEKAFRRIMSTTTQLGTMNLIRITLKTVLGYDTNRSLAEEEHLRSLDHRLLMQETHSARWNISHNNSQHPEVPFEDRYLTLDSAYPVIINLTGRDIIAADEEYRDLLQKMIVDSREDHLALHRNWQSPLLAFRDANDFKEHFASINNHKRHDISQPKSDDRKLPVDQVLIIDSGALEPLVYSAASRALNITPYPDDDTQTCVSSVYTPARGAALRAADWVTYYEAEFGGVSGGYYEVDGVYEWVEDLGQL
ncbi:hypothetical protein GLAREA_00161 [Glarea lozoyensis ATCC 20868]|uniref:Uncharacterized protein n=1 Tax=Glarea lozoyensis (strain ATCC 20868 / MF5171) TaxID=1116229 RepID=S3DRA4_GLAL2|nr:uncharacterized protein GLAREA_00161 [Glarea lozoyensis ATCC 20868]EPE29003.1 hypothetical protein GLAREA_00161 [Glarea lozoyensis ATCC 20868]